MDLATDRYGVMAVRGIRAADGRWRGKGRVDDGQVCVLAEPGARCGGRETIARSGERVRELRGVPRPLIPSITGCCCLWRWLSAFALAVGRQREVFQSKSPVLLQASKSVMRKVEFIS